MRDSDYEGFSTKDSDTASEGNTQAKCAVAKHGAWWYGVVCAYANLNGRYIRPNETNNGDGIFWASWLGANNSFMRTVMKLKPSFGIVILTIMNNNE